MWTIPTIIIVGSFLICLYILASRLYFLIGSKVVLGVVTDVKTGGNRSVKLNCKLEVDGKVLHRSTLINPYIHFYSVGHRIKFYVKQGKHTYITNGKPGFIIPILLFTIFMGICSYAALKLNGTI